MSSQNNEINNLCSPRLEFAFYIKLSEYQTKRHDLFNDVKTALDFGQVSKWYGESIAFAKHLAVQTILNQIYCMNTPLYANRYFIIILNKMSSIKVSNEKYEAPEILSVGRLFSSCGCLVF